VTHTLHRLKTYSKAKTVASAAPAASFWWATRTLPKTVQLLCYRICVTASRTD